MTDIPISRNFTHPRIYLFRMLIFIFLILFFILLIQEDLTKAFQTNPVINTVISSVLGFGIIYILW
ncbi:MAG: hypothetical protein VXW64_05285, partial [Pseudomonadota bacterium]|nr:hypothetical protein [Pseudomonadota bacterium]